MVIIKCKMCGGELALTQGSTIATCEYCGTVQTVPSMDDEKKLLQFERAERLRKNCDFDKAAGIYESIVADFRYEAEAYWSLVLCKYGIEYVDDPATGKKVPTCHRSSFDSVMEDSNFEQVLENANAAARKIYREEAKQIEEIRKGIVAVSNNEEPYDIFICYKETAENGERTIDSVLAQDIYDALTEKGHRVFFSRITLEDKLGQEYEPYIFAALNSAKVMLAIGTDYEYYNAVWVKNEWSRYLKLMEKDKSKHLIPCFKGIDAYDMPKEFSKLQAQDLGKVGAVQDLLRGIDKLITAKPVMQTAQLSEEDVKREYLYNSAVEAANSRNPKQIQTAIKKLESLGNWKDAPEQLAAARKSLKQAKAQKRNRILLIFCIIASLIGGLFIYADYNGKRIQYEQAEYQEKQYDYKMAIDYYKEAAGFRDSEERIAKLEQLYTETEKALMKLGNCEEVGGEFTVNYQIRGTESTANFYMFWDSWYDFSGEASTYWQAGFYMDGYTEDELEAFTGNGSGSCRVRYDIETREYLFIGGIGDSTIYFRGKLNNDGSLTIYNDAGITYTLIPKNY